MKCMTLVLLLAMAVCNGAIAASSGETAPAVALSAAPETPDSHVTDLPERLLKALKTNDFAAYLQIQQGDDDIVAVAERWNNEVKQRQVQRAKRTQELAEAHSDDSEPTVDDPLQQVWMKLQSDEGIELLVAEWQPMIDKQATESIKIANIGFGAKLMSLANDRSFNAEEVQQLTQLMYAVQAWTYRVDFADPQRLRDALTAISGVVRQSGLKSHSDLSVMMFEDAVVHGDATIAAIKQVMSAYDLDADQILQSVRLSEVDAFGDRATLRIQARLLGVEVSHDLPMQFSDGAWRDADDINAFGPADTDTSTPVGPAAKPVATIGVDASVEPMTGSDGNTASSCSPENEYADQDLPTPKP